MQSHPASSQDWFLKSFTQNIQTVWHLFDCRWCSADSKQKFQCSWCWWLILCLVIYKNCVINMLTQLKTWFLLEGDYEFSSLASRRKKCMFHYSWLVDCYSGSVDQAGSDANVSPKPNVNVKKRGIFFYLSAVWCWCHWRTLSMCFCVFWSPELYSCKNLDPFLSH